MRDFSSTASSILQNCIYRAQLIGGFADGIGKEGHMERKTKNCVGGSLSCIGTHKS